jgi:hypothetical protein
MLNQTAENIALSVMFALMFSHLRTEYFGGRLLQIHQPRGVYK